MRKNKIMLDEQRNLFNPYKNISLIFKKKFQEKDNAYICFNSSIKFDEENFNEKNFKQNIQVDIFDMINAPIEHRNSIHPFANKVMENCKLSIAMFDGKAQSGAISPQMIIFTKKENGYNAFLSTKVSNPIHLSAILASMNQSTELSIKIDLLCDDSAFSKLEDEKTLQVIVHELSMSFNLPTIDTVIKSLT
jgi:hypothetical protein